MKKIILFIIATTLLISLAGCASYKPQSPEGLSITGLSTSIGSYDGGIDTQQYSYTCTIQNNGRNDYQLQSIEPVLSDTFKAKVLDTELKTIINKTISSKNYLTVSGNFRIDTRGLSKEDILVMTGSQPEKFQVLATIILDLPGYGKR